MKVTKPGETISERSAPESQADESARSPWRAQLQGMSFEQARQALQPEGQVALQLASEDHTPGTHAIAGRAFNDPAGSLPHQAAIESSYGVDMSAVQAYKGPEAKAACNAMGARAFALGHRVAFAEANPSLHLVAHEAAHVVQQSKGVQLSDKVGRPGDAYEVAADRAAGRVAAGESAGDLLPSVEKVQTMGSSAVQRYTDQSVDGTPFRVADDASMAVNAETIYGSKIAYADPSLIASASKELEAGTSVMSLEPGSSSITVEDEKGTKRSIPDVVVTNKNNQTSDMDMLLYADCGRSARTVTGADGGRGDGSGNLAANYKGADGSAKSAARWESGSFSKSKIVAEHMPSIQPAIQRLISQRQAIIAGWRSAKDEAAKDAIRAQIAGVERAMWSVCEAKLNTLSPEERDALEKKMGVNRYADPEVGEAFHISTGGATHPELEKGGKTWNFHWAGVVMKSGSDSLTLENYAVGDYEAQNTEWVYQLYGVGKKSGQSFHEQHKDVHKQHGASPTTMSMGKR